MEHDSHLDMAAVEARHWWFAGRRRVLTTTIKRLQLKPGVRFVELGSGAGGNLAMLAQFGQVMAVEMSGAAREISAARATGAEILPGMLPGDLPLGGLTYDLVCLFDVLEHVAEDEAALAVVRGLIAPTAWPSSRCRPMPLCLGRTMSPCIISAATSAARCTTNCAAPDCRS